MSDEPLQYRVRPAAILDVVGEDRSAFLQGQLTQDVRLAGPGPAVSTAGLTPKGKILFVARLAALPDRFRLVLPAALRERVVAHLSKYAVFQKVNVLDRSDHFLRIGLRGGPLPLPLPLSPAGGTEAMRLGPEDEFSEDLLLPSASLEEARRALEAAGARPLDAARAETLRVEAGRPEFGIDFDETHLTDEVGLDGFVSATKGCYVGQEIVARLRTYGRVHRRLVGFRFPDGPIEPGEALGRGLGEAPARVEPGRVTTSVDSPRFGAIGLGWALREFEIGHVLVALRDEKTLRRAVVAALPFS